MANIDEYIKQIQQAQYGEEVRGSIVNALKKVNDDNNSYVAIKKEVVAAKDIVEEKAEIFDEKANAAKETLTALQASTQIANEAKSSLNNIISSAISTKKELEQAVLETGEVIARVDNAKSNLDKSITSAGKAELNLQRQIDTSNQIKNQLDVSSSAAIELKKNLDVAINEANTAKVKLVEAINNAGNAALEKIETAQSVATRAVETAKVEAVKAITTAGTTETEKVTAEGTKQVGLVKTEGEKQVQEVQTAAQEIVADREQIAKNATDIADLRQNKADAITETASGTLLNVKDSANAFFEDFFMAGKTTQDGTPTPDVPMPIVNAGKDGTIEIKITGKNLLPNTRIPDKTENGITMKYKADGVYHLSGTSTNRFDSYTLNLSDISFPPGKYRILTGKNVKSQIVVMQKNTEQDIWYGYEFTINKGDKIKYWYCIVSSGKIVDEDIHVYMERDTGNTLTVKDFEPPREPQTITLQLDRPLTKWDKLEKREDIWGIARKSKAVDLSTEDWFEYKNTVYPGGIHCYSSIFENSMFKYNSSLCTHFKNVSNAWDNEIAKIGIYSDHISVRNKYFISDKPTVEGFKTWLLQQKEAGTPVEVVYETETETWEPLPEETQKTLNALHTNYPTTVATNNAGAEMELSYVADTKNYTDNKIKEAVSAQTQSLANLLSLMPLSTQAAMIEADTNNILENVEEMKYE